ncbi:hypothetical protein [Burkholderia sp. TSV86]|uniref:hypothetical protein n=1 Tax=Burkholderia sp. TSV86 TaxID=1385594 RepID=UPI000753DFFE|nr:hypothetical protein [Burkholderia sp. TSV86]KVE32478.1 hypothetical protein WS68_15045 [Burkholderia sp. TSV86]
MHTPRFLPRPPARPGTRPARIARAVVFVGLLLACAAAAASDKRTGEPSPAISRAAAAASDAPVNAAQ